MCDPDLSLPVPHANSRWQLWAFQRRWDRLDSKRKRTAAMTPNHKDGFINFKAQTFQKCIYQKYHTFRYSCRTFAACFNMDKAQICVCVCVCVGQACTGNHTWYVDSSKSDIKSKLNSKYQLVTQFAFYLLTFILIVGAIKNSSIIIKLSCKTNNSLNFDTVLTNIATITAIIVMALPTVNHWQTLGTTDIFQHHFLPFNHQQHPTVQPQRSARRPHLAQASHKWDSQMCNSTRGSTSTFNYRKRKGMMQLAVTILLLFGGNAELNEWLWWLWK